ncbi:tetratricopeptide repeat protein [Corallococcus sp. 4LFB]|uniref:tetratricopeptide repeat protein n=1 Tax=Corallococcus sp. 4LFB TaxID=3383249 RepID=UPI003976DF9A
MQALRRDFPRDLQVRLGLARALLGLERHREAEAELREALVLSPGDPEALKVLAVLALRQGEGARAAPTWPRPWSATLRRGGEAAARGAGGRGPASASVPEEQVPAPGVHRRAHRRAGPRGRGLPAPGPRPAGEAGLGRRGPRGRGLAVCRVSRGTRFARAHRARGGAGLTAGRAVLRSGAHGGVVGCAASGAAAPRLRGGDPGGAVPAGARGAGGLLRAGGRGVHALPARLRAEGRRAHARSGGRGGVAQPGAASRRRAARRHRPGRGAAGGGVLRHLGGDGRRRP